jgi:hypothetical protein
MTRLESDPRFASIGRSDWIRFAADACRIAVRDSGLDDERVGAALRALEQTELDADIATSMRERSDRLDEEAWDAEARGADDRYVVLFRRSRAASALAFALAGEPGEAIYEAAFALTQPEDLIRRLGA